MKNFTDRIPVTPNRRKITFEAEPVNGINYATVEFADGATVTGTPLNREAFLAIQGFQTLHTTFNNITGDITETDADDNTLITSVVGNVITEVYTCGTQTATRTTTFNINGSISEVIS